jgi:hypothetical protein
MPEVRRGSLRRQQCHGSALPIELGHVDQHHRGVATRGGSDHVARVLLVARRVGDDELARSRGEIAECDVDRDALFAFRFEAVEALGSVGIQVDCAHGRFLGFISPPRR